MQINLFWFLPVSRFLRVIVQIVCASPYSLLLSLLSPFSKRSLFRLRNAMRPPTVCVTVFKLICESSKTSLIGMFNFILDTEIIQFALTLEHIEVAFYTLALQQLFSQSDFIKAGYTPLVFQRFVEIGQHEQTHVELLTAALGDKAPLACNYSLCVFGNGVLGEES